MYTPQKASGLPRNLCPPCHLPPPHPPNWVTGKVGGQKAIRHQSPWCEEIRNQRGFLPVWDSLGVITPWVVSPLAPAWAPRYLTSLHCQAAFHSAQEPGPMPCQKGPAGQQPILVFGPSCLQPISLNGWSKKKKKSWEGPLSMPLHQIQDPRIRESPCLSEFPLSSHPQPNGPKQRCSQGIYSPGYQGGRDAGCFLFPMLLF